MADSNKLGVSVKGEYFQQLWSGAGFLIKTMRHAFTTVGAWTTAGSSAKSGAQTLLPGVLTSLFSALQILTTHKRPEAAHYSTTLRGSVPENVKVNSSSLLAVHGGLTTSQMTVIRGFIVYITQRTHLVATL
jgi:hypothetical protein